MRSVASKPNYFAKLTTFALLEEFVLKFIVEQKGCATTSLQPHRAVNLNSKKVKYFGMSKFTAQSLTGDQYTNCNNCPVELENKRSSQCVSCSTEIGIYMYIVIQMVIINFTIAKQHSSILQTIKTNVIEASMDSCFPSEIILAMVSRLSIEKDELVTTSDGWRPCKLKNYR